MFNNDIEAKKIFYWLPTTKEMKLIKTKDAFFKKITEIYQLDIDNETKEIINLLGEKFLSDNLEKRLTITEYQQFIRAFSTTISEKESSFIYPIVIKFLKSTNEEILDELLKLIPECDMYAKEIKARLNKQLEECNNKLIELEQSANNKTTLTSLKEISDNIKQLEQKIKEIELVQKKLNEKKYPLYKDGDKKHGILLTDYFYIVLHINSKANQVPKKCVNKIIEKENSIKLYNEIFGANVSFDINEEEMFEECLQQFVVEIEEYIKKKGPLVQYGYEQIFKQLVEHLATNVDRIINFSKNNKDLKKYLIKRYKGPLYSAKSWHYVAKTIKYNCDKKRKH